MSSLQSKAINSVKWTAFQTLFLGISAPLLLLIKARFLTPAEFGVLAIATIFIGLFQTINNFGISQAIIQKEKVSKEELATIFTFNMVLVSILSLILFFSSGLISSIFSLENLSYLLKLLCLIILINGPSLLFRAILEKSMEFRLISLINIISETSLLIITFLFLYFDYGMVGVIYAQILSALLNAFLVIVLSYRKTEYRFSLNFHYYNLEPFLNFGLFVFAKELMTFLTNRLDQIIIGYFLSAEILGLYSFAKNMLERFRNLITSSFSKVLFPLLAKIKNDLTKLKFVYNKISLFIGLVAIPIFLGVSITADLFVPLIFGEEWTASVKFFQIFSIVLIPLVLTANLSTSLLYSLNKPKIVLYIDLMINSIYIFLLALFAEKGINYIILVYCIYVLLKTSTLQYVTSRYLLSSFKKYLLLYKDITLSSLFMIVIVVIVKNISIIENLAINLMISVLAGGLVYLISVSILNKGILEDFFKTLANKNSIN